jgi:Aerobic-type carbon monoxide dehydrogenase, large subunit CoxL/CutL homologs
VAPEKVEVHNLFLGGGFGRRAMNDELIQAVTVAKAVGRPVKLLWTRENDMQHDRYRPQAALRARALLVNADIEAIHLQTAVGSISRSLGWKQVGHGIEPSAVEGLANQPYAATAQLVECVLKNTHIPIMFWRSVGSSQNAFVVESFIDELAHAAGEDPYKFRRRLLADRPDFVKVLDVAADKADWGTPMPQGKAAASPSMKASAPSWPKWPRSPSAPRARSRSSGSRSRWTAAMSSTPAWSRCRWRAA